MAETATADVTAVTELPLNPEAAVSEPAPADDGDVWVEEAPESPSQEWETSDKPVGLENIDPEKVAEMKNAMADNGSQASSTNGKTPTFERLYSLRSSQGDVGGESREEREAKECTFRPELVSSSKIRGKASSHNYGKETAKVKPAPAPEEPAFKPDLSVTEKKRQRASSHNYGKEAAPPRKVVEPPQPDFKPQLVDKGKTKTLRENASPRYLASQEKFASAGKEARAEAERRKSSVDAKYTLLADRPSTAPGPGKTGGATEPPNFRVDNIASAEKDPLKRRAVAPVPPVKHTKSGETLKAKATSHYAKTAYTPPKGERPVKKADPSWGIVSVKPATVPATLLSPVKPNKKTATATSHYAADSYTPPKAERPKTAPSSAAKTDFNLITRVPDSPLNKPASEIPVPRRKSKKFESVASSGYGVVNPVPSVPAKVQGLKHRTGSAKVRSDAKWGEKDSGRDSANSNAENETSPFGEESMAQINDLIQKAASLDPAAVDSGGEEQLTML